MLFLVGGLCVLLLVWGLKEEDIGWIGALIYFVIAALSLASGFLNWLPIFVGIAVTAVIDIILLFRCGIADAVVRP
ncbi:MAG: hypothetical protein JSS66_12595 [Armatimonadetes bacterium]|nr:hypothetical protein [Armatimonadota bacterium]